MIYGAIVDKGCNIAQSVKLSSHEQCSSKKLQQSICIHTEQRNLLNKICQWIFTKVYLLYNICSRVHINDDNSPNITWANTFVHLNYHLCLGFQCHIIFVANQNIFDFGQSFTNVLWQKKTLGSCNGDLVVNEKVVQSSSVVDKD